VVVKGSGDFKTDAYIYFDEIDGEDVCGCCVEGKMEMEQFDSIACPAFLHVYAHTIEMMCVNDGDGHETTISLQFTMCEPFNAINILSKLLVTLPSQQDFGLKKIKLTSSASDMNNLGYLRVSCEVLKKLVGNPTMLASSDFNLVDKVQAAPTTV
jgi:hypothetical protein